MTKKVRIREFDGLEFPLHTYEFTSVKFRVYMEKGLEDIIIVDPYLTPNNPTITTRQTKIFLTDDNGERLIFKVIFQHDPHLSINQSARTIRPGIEWRGPLLVIKYIGDRVKDLRGSEEAAAVAAIGEFLEQASQAITIAAGIVPVNFPKVINFQHTGFDADAFLEDP